MVTVLPEPDSPIRHRTSPRIRWNETPLTVASRLTNLTRRSSTSTSGCVAAIGVHCVVSRLPAMTAMLFDLGPRQADVVPAAGRECCRAGQRVSGGRIVHMTGGEM